MTVIRGDLTYYKQGWGGGHEFRAGMWAAPRLVRETTTEYVNDGLYLQEDRFIDADHPSAGYFPFHLRYRLPAIAQTINEHDSDIAFYAQDAWSPTRASRSTAALASTSTGGRTSSWTSTG